MDDQLSLRSNAIRSTSAGHDDRVTRVHAHIREDVSLSGLIRQHIARQPYRGTAEIGDANVGGVLVILSEINRVHGGDFEVSDATGPDTDPTLSRLSLESKE